MLNILSRLFTTLAAVISRLSFFQKKKRFRFSFELMRRSLGQNLLSPDCSSTALENGVGPAQHRPGTVSELWWVQPGVALARTWEGKTETGARGLQARDFAHSTMGMGLCCSSGNSQLLLRFPN